MTRFLSPLFLLLAIAGPVAESKVLDDGDGVFFPPAVADTVHTFKSFPVFWWNFLVLEPNGTLPDFARARAACHELRGRTDLLARVECGDDLSGYRPIVAAWAGDVVLRRDAPTRAELKSRLDEAMARASLPMPKDLLETLRADPLGEYASLLAHAQKRLKLALERKSGFFVDDATGRIVVPVQPAFPPEQSARLLPVLEKLPEWALLGPHGSTIENRERIRIDLERVSLAGTIILLGFALYLAVRGQWRLWVVFPPVFAAAFLSALTVRFFCGSVHGLVLAFGTGIIGLTVDYGLHLAYASHPERVWRSNFAGFATTMVCLLVLMSSAVPLLRQLMLFSALGFAYAYLLLWVTYKAWPKAFHAEPLGVRLRATRWGVASAVALGLAAVVGGAVLRPAFDLRQLDYQSPRTARLAEWLFRKTGPMRPLFEPVSGFDEAVRGAVARERWRESAVPRTTLESVADYVPETDARRRHLDTWKRTLCEEESFAGSLPPTHRKLFAPFLEAIRCDALDARAAAVADAPYLRHLRSGDRWLALWLPSDAADAMAVQKAYPKAQSLMAVVSTFPALLTSELRWMGPLSVLLVFLILAWHFRSARLAAWGLVPFVAGTGAVLLRSLLLHEQPSFVTLVGLVMMLGLSVDYAIFVLDHLRGDSASEDSREARGAGTALWLSAATTVLGFLPLVFCEHRVLAHLGWALVLGTLGTVACAGRALPALGVGRGATS